MPSPPKEIKYNNFQIKTQENVSPLKILLQDERLRSRVTGFSPNKKSYGTLEGLRKSLTKTVTDQDVNVLPLARIDESP